MPTQAAESNVALLALPAGDYKSKGLWAVAESPSNTLLAAVWPQPFGRSLLSTFLPVRVTSQTKVITGLVNPSFLQALLLLLPLHRGTCLDCAPPSPMSFKIQWWAP